MPDARIIPIGEAGRSRRQRQAGQSAGHHVEQDGTAGVEPLPRRPDRDRGDRDPADGRPGAEPTGTERIGEEERHAEEPARDELDELAAEIGQAVGRAAEHLLGEEWRRRLAGALAFTRRRLTGDYEVDEYGFDSELTEHVLAGLVRPLYRHYFRVELRGVENVPSAGGALVVANHSGTVPLDAVMTRLALLDHHPAHRHLRMLAADLVFRTPFVGELARKSGATLACHEDAERLLAAGELVGVWPEGFKGIGKPFADRYKLQRFGRGGFVSAALRTRTPIIPVSIVGAEEIYPMLGNAKLLARLLHLPYVPITPTFPWLGPLGLLPLPSKWIIEFGEPIETTGHPPGAADDPMLVFNLTDEVRETIQRTLYRLLLQRRSVFR